MSSCRSLLRRAALSSVLLFTAPGASHACAAPVHKVIVDMDIGDDIDDAFALALLLLATAIVVLLLVRGWRPGVTR